MLPAQSVTIPNLAIEAAYLPAQEIGGDFFQTSQTSDGSLLMIMGDVSGKGLQAALTVSLLVGLWQDVIDAVEQSPSNVLRRLNEHLLSRISGGFVSCLCVRLKTDGSLAIANAGHLAPYINAVELNTDTGLPLGITSEVEYKETNHLLAPADVLVLISDGVVEARDKARKFYGFERLQQALLGKLSAHAISSRAQHFGQKDAITVISHGTRTQVGDLPRYTVNCGSSALSPSERTVARYLRRSRRRGDPAKSWLTFLQNHHEVIVAMEFFTAPTITFQHDIHVILDNLSAHKSHKVASFLKEHPNVRLHSTPTYSSWLNQVEIWFSRIEREVIARGLFRSVRDLSRKLIRYIRSYSKTATGH
jgi:transposase